MSDNHHIIRDPIHGFIKVSNLEREIINSFPFQRLRRIRQLGMSYLVYPGAEHSRFSHSLGVMEFATKVFDILISKHNRKGELNWDDERVKKNRQLLRLAALLHDIGHAPFSHASESLFPDGKDHEDCTLALIGSAPIKDIIDQFPVKENIQICAKDVVEFFDKKTIQSDILFLREIFSGELDADKMDYLSRDSYFAGVNYGKFDYERLINTLILIPHPAGTGSNVLAIEEGGVHALEGLVLARYFMFTQVYFHKITRIYDLMMVEYLKAVVKKYPQDLDQFLMWDDYRVMEMIKGETKNDYARRILQRDHLVNVFQTDEHMTDEQATRAKWLQQEVQRKFPDVPMVFDEAERATHKFAKTDFYIVRKDGSSPLVNVISKIINNLSKIQEFRIYTTREKDQEVRTFCQDFWSAKSK